VVKGKLCEQRQSRVQPVAPHKTELPFSWGSGQLSIATKLVMGRPLLFLVPQVHPGSDLAGHPTLFSYLKIDLL